MKSNFSHIGLAKLCGWAGITRQAYYKDSWRQIGVSTETFYNTVRRHKYLNNLTIKEFNQLNKNNLNNAA